MENTRIPQKNFQEKLGETPKKTEKSQNFSNPRPPTVIVVNHKRGKKSTALENRPKATGQIVRLRAIAVPSKQVNNSGVFVAVGGGPRKRPCAHSLCRQKRAYVGLHQRIFEHLFNYSARIQR